MSILDLIEAKKRETMNRILERSNYYFYSETYDDKAVVTSAYSPEKKTVAFESAESGTSLAEVFP